MTQIQIPRFNVQGVGISAVNLETAVAAILDAVRTGRKGYVCVTGVHGVTEAQKEPSLRDVFNRSFLTTPDGMPMVWLGRLKFGSSVDRVYGPDLMTALMEATRALPVSHFFYGGKPGVAGELKAKLEARHPGIRICGVYTPPFRPLNSVEEQELIGIVAAARPQIIWVGISTPKQDQFMAAWIDRLDTVVMIGVGAAFDFYSGRVRQAPRFIQRSGFEWLYRLLQEPRRLWRRSLVTNSLFLFRLLLEALRLWRPPPLPPQDKSPS